MNQNDILSRMEELISSKLEAFESRMETSQRDISQAQLAKIQQNLTPTDNYTYRKKGNEEQHKVNNKILGAFKEADGFLRDEIRTNPSEAILSASRKISEGMDIINHREKLIRLADSSDSGWRVVQEYEAHPLADDSDDKKKIYRSQMKADRKLKLERHSRGRRFTPYPTGTSATATTSQQHQGNQSSQGWNQSTNSGRRPGLCFRCGRSGHWRLECKAVMPERGQVNKENQISTQKLHVIDHNENLSTLQKSEDKSPVGKLKGCYEHWVDAGANAYILDVVSQGYKLLFRNIPNSVILKNNMSARKDPEFVSGEIERLLKMECISEVKEGLYIVNPLTVAYGKSGKPRLVLDCRHINLELFKYKCCFEDQSVAKQLFSKGDFLFDFDIRGAYHHIMIYPAHRTFLGFSWQYGKVTRYFVFNVLAFWYFNSGFHIFKIIESCS